MGITFVPSSHAGRESDHFSNASLCPSNYVCRSQMPSSPDRSAKFNAIRAAGWALRSQRPTDNAAAMTNTAFTPARTEAATHWALRLLGAVELADDHGRLARVPSRAALLLLARLAIAPRRQHPREELVELLWPGVGTETGRNRLRQALSVLRSVLEPAGRPGVVVLQADRRAIWLAPDAVHCDVPAFLRALRTGDASGAARLYGGDLLPGHFDDWVIEERQRLECRAAGLSAQEDSVAAVPVAAPEMRHASPGSAAPAAGAARLPRYLTRLVGFEAEGAALAAALPYRRLVVVRGPGGAGKTRLAVEVARTMAERSGWQPETAPGDRVIFDFVAFVPLVECTTRAQMLEAILRALRQQAGASAADEAQRVESALAGRRVLMVLDNFEQLVEAGRADVARWLAHLPLLHLLVTSRRALGLDGEVEHALAALPLPEAGASLQDHAMNPAMALFGDRARAARADFHLNERNHAAVADIVSALHGLPLAIELAAARIRSLGLADMRAMLVGDGVAPQPLALLARSGPRSADDERHASMLNVLAWSWRQLAAPEQDLLAMLSACDGGASLNLLGHLSDVGAANTALLVDQLVAASVAYRRESTAGASRYHAFEPMREFVFHETGAAGVARLRARHAHAVAAWAAALGTEPALDMASAEWPNLTRALASAADATLPQASAEQAIDTTLAARSALDDLSLSAHALDHLRHIAAAAPQYHAAALQAVLAMQSFNAGQASWADRHVDAALAALEAADSTERAEVLRCAGIIRLRRGAPLDAVQSLLDQALALARAHRQRDTEARALTHWALLQYRRHRDLAANVPIYRQALALWRQHGPRTRATSGLLSLALQLGGKQLAAEQLVMLDEVRASTARTGQHRLLALATSVTGYALADLRRFDESAAMYRQCLQMDWDHGHWREWFYVLWNLPRTLACQGRAEAAARLMGFAEAYCAEHFGALGPEDLPEARRTRRLIALRTGRTACQALWRQGAGMSMAEAMALATAETAPRPGV